MRDFRKLLIWQKAHRLALDVQLALDSDSARRYTGLRPQILRAAASIPANIAEGCGKSSDSELLRFSEFALGSATELDNHLLLARDSGTIDAEAHARLESRVAELRRMIYGFMRAIRARNAKQ